MTWWSGQLLGSRRIAMYLFTMGSDSRSTPLSPLLAAVRGDAAGAIVPVDQLPDLVVMHRDLELVCFDAAEAHGVLLALFQAMGREDAVDALWAFASKFRLRDLSLLALAVTDAVPTLPLTGLIAMRPALAARRIGDLQQLAQAIAGAARANSDQTLPAQLAEQALGAVDALDESYRELESTALKAVRDRGIAEEVIVSFGPLAVGLFAQAAIVGAHAGRHGLPVDPTAIRVACEKLSRSAKLF